MMFPQVTGRTVTTNLMRDAIAAQAKFIRRNTENIIGYLSPAS